MQKHILFPVLLLLAMTVTRASAQSPAPPRWDPAFLHFFIGRWSGEGQFAQGNKIAADVSFQLSLDSSWLLYEHRDRAPGPYKATSLWGLDGQTGAFVAYAFDNFHGHREFVSGGWKNGKLVLTTHDYYPQVGNYFEHFIYEKLSETSFKMTYETSLDGIGWQLGDWLVFTKTGE